MINEYQILQGKYRHVFINEIGLEVLADILHECHFGDTMHPDNNMRLGEYNIGVTILGKMGIFSEFTLKQVVNALSSVVPPKPKEEER